ncbi:hypothetical protein HRE53_30375 (plasmid) [Acaryochloris sp. 'Moss Beach']|uniref:hypothetical protein n=1 Tax=Acaryochloris TaxID=155977 RepID=UPI001BB00E53|nr:MULTISPECIES: hypothetical protein [Acaryochloris]QUY46293.1 hypothetical protein I1H34_31835 [Acaryochloris marina S15]UJB72905.1 hypothetical protein HRE53_30375 [Acaryochloris sp. 'Moss Beach']
MLTLAETSIFTLHLQFNNPNLFAAMEDCEDSQDLVEEVASDGEAPSCTLLGRMGRIDGVAVGYLSDGTPLRIE